MASHGKLLKASLTRNDLKGLTQTIFGKAGGTTFAIWDQFVRTYGGDGELLKQSIDQEDT
jgi:hypothetical protein